jgi:4-amino-4-deoxy-L-arabinose transferase-like glycosyltransferase
MIMRWFNRLTPQRLLWAIVGIALLLRVIWVLMAPRVDPFLRDNPLYGDATGYNILAVNLTRGLGLTWDGVTPTAVRPPGYPVFLAMIYLIFGENYAFVRLAQALLGALTCVPVYWVASRFGGKGVALIAALGVAVYPLLIYFTGWQIAETIAIFLYWGALAAFLRAKDTQKAMWIVLAGLLFGMGSLVRPQMMLLPVALCLVGWLLGSNWGVRWTLCAIVISTCLVIAPWMVRNRLVLGAWVPVATLGGLNLYAANNSTADGGFSSDVPMSILPGMSEPESDRQYTKMALTWISENPRSFLALLPKKLVRFFSPLERTMGGVSEGLFAAVVSLTWYVLLLFAIYGIWVLQRQNPVAGALILVTPILYEALLILIFHGGSRYALPTIPILLIGGASTIVSAADHVRRRRRAPTPVAAWQGKRRE